MSNYFLQTLQQLRHYEEVILYDNMLQVTEQQQHEAVSYLEKEYATEALNYPYSAPDFDSTASLWAAKTVYIATQLMLHRANKGSDMQLLLPAYEHEITSAAMMSADLLLRFLPDVISQLKVIDPEDKLITILEKHLKTWHYSGIAHTLAVNELDFAPVSSNACFLQMYVDRVIENKKISLAKQPALIKGIRASLGFFDNILWTDFKQQLSEINEHN